MKPFRTWSFWRLGASSRTGPTTGIEVTARPDQQDDGAVNKIHADDWDDEEGSVAPTEASSVASMKRVSEERAYNDGQEVDPSRSFAFKWCGMDMVVDRRTVYLLAGLPLALLVLVLLGMLISFLAILKTAKVPDMRIKECALQRAWLDGAGRMNAEVRILAGVHNREQREAIIRGGKVSLFYVAGEQQGGVELGQVVIDRNVLPKRPGSIALERVLAITDLRGIRDGLGDRLVGEVLGRGNSTFHLAGHLPIYVSAGPVAWLPATLHVNCVFKHTWGRPLGDGATVCQNKLHLQ